LPFFSSQIFVKKEVPVSRHFGVWTSEECALVLIDYPKDRLESIRSETPADLIELHARWLARSARFVTDAVRSRSVIAHGPGVERLSLAGAVSNTALGVVAAA
jgi:hypothetical protein